MKAPFLSVYPKINRDYEKKSSGNKMLNIQNYYIRFNGNGNKKTRVTHA